MKGYLIALATVALGLPASTTARASFTFSFDSAQLSPGDGDAKVGAYMTSVYGSAVTTLGAIVGQGNGFGTATNKYIKNNAALLQINFSSHPITSLKFQGHFFTGTSLTVDAYRGNTLIYQHTFSGTTGSTFTSGTIKFSGDATRLVFAASGSNTIGVDELTVTPNPAPASLVLLAIGLGCLLVYHWLPWRWSGRTMAEATAPGR